MTEVLQSFRNIALRLRKVLDTDQPTVCVHDVRNVLAVVESQQEMLELGLFDMKADSPES